jgi:exopolyphosphatase / guanosine-5'-triphosphate,3'-diphosphate pyrophosphatase
VACACIDIGSNTTRLLVADARDGVLRELLAQRAFTRIGKSLGKDKSIPAGKLAETAEVVAAQARMARASYRTTP